MTFLERGELDFKLKIIRFIYSFFQFLEGDQLLREIRTNSHFEHVQSVLYGQEENGRNE